MWVSTTGEDSPQCIHDIQPASDQLKFEIHHVIGYKPCRSLNYALQHVPIGFGTSSFITCGIHVLELLNRFLYDWIPLLNIAVVGVCANYPPTILCANGANLAFLMLTLLDLNI